MTDTHDEQQYGSKAVTTQERLPLAREGVETIVWHLPHCDILIEQRDGVTYVNGQAVEPVEVTLARRDAKVGL